MIGLLRGKILDKQPPQLLLDVNGVGYEVDAPMTTFYDLPDVGAEVMLFTHLAVREDAHTLYGFAKRTDRFRKMQHNRLTGRNEICLRYYSAARLDAGARAVDNQVSRNLSSQQSTAGSWTKRSL